MRTFDSFSAFAAYLESLARTAPQAEHKAMDEASQDVLTAAKAMPGRYQTGWPQLAAATKADRVRRGFSPNDPLLRTGELRDSYQRNVADHRHAEIGSNDKRAAWFEMGTSRMPPRPVLLTAGTEREKPVHDIIGRRIYRHLCGDTGGE